MPGICKSILRRSRPAQGNLSLWCIARLRLVRIGVSAVPLTPASSGGGRGCRAARHVSASGSAALVAAARTGALVRERQPEEQRLQIGGEVTRRAQVLAQDVTDAADGFALNW